ncbi:hypothetical protein [Aliiruegeria sabulilitoris]|uniref:hypothetical protein n=1 Tax=Aliiruegeria sabulilitoris TaxID=1510458 RepID=UPI0012E35793|nr:hypothetical protein [Aliiruegeria sabulilitoris]NDR55345.1 hypothetical protein [Pseudoruegeria sp. M32A2M]
MATIKSSYIHGQRGARKIAGRSLPKFGGITRTKAKAGKTLPESAVYRDSKTPADQEREERFKMRSKADAAEEKRKIDRRNGNPSSGKEISSTRKNQPQSFETADSSIDGASGRSKQALSFKEQAKKLGVEEVELRRRVRALRSFLLSR